MPASMRRFTLASGESAANAIFSCATTEPRSTRRMRASRHASKTGEILSSQTVKASFMSGAFDRASAIGVPCVLGATSTQLFVGAARPRPDLGSQIGDSTADYSRSDATLVRLPVLANSHPACLTILGICTKCLSEAAVFVATRPEHDTDCDCDSRRCLIRCSERDGVAT